ncbi:hypothetical protein HY837_00810 [archaeon]|nr:hypothetical protein [archaeon]
MVNLQLIRKIIESEDVIVPVLFKPVQFNILKKLDKNYKLTDNEKRYLRGKMHKKIIALEKLMQKEEISNELVIFLNNINSYYITGLEALKHNGYGWYYEPKSVEIINTKISGMINLLGKSIKFIKIKSVAKSKIVTNRETGLKYATNPQIIKDVVFTKNSYTKNICNQMLNRYGKMFSDKNKAVIKEAKIDYSKYGV